MSADRNLLFGVLALQMDFIDRDQLVRGMNAWVLEKHKPLAEILVEHVSGFGRTSSHGPSSLRTARRQSARTYRRTSSSGSERSPWPASAKKAPWPSCRPPSAKRVSTYGPTWRSYCGKPGRK
jgi:hypothetical protein